MAKLIVMCVVALAVAATAAPDYRSQGVYDGQRGQVVYRPDIRQGSLGQSGLGQGSYVQGGYVQDEFGRVKSVRGPARGQIGQTGFVRGQTQGQVGQTGFVYRPTRYDQDSLVVKDQHLGKTYY